MTYKQMTETEIMKEIERLLRIAKFFDSDCVTSPIETQVLVALQDLINRKNAEIDRLTEIEEAHREQNGELRKEVERKNAEIEKLCGEVDELIIAKDQLFDEAEALIKKARAEAIKEVLEKVRSKVSCILRQHYFTPSQVLCDLDQIAKEMGVKTDV